MKRFFLLLTCALMVWNVSAQIAQTFVPETGKSYFIKSQDPRSRNTSYLVEDESTGNLAIVPMTAAEVVLKETAKWNVTYTPEKGYMIQNVATGNYLKYVGFYEASEGASAGDNFVLPSTKDDLDEEVRYYMAATANKNGAYSVGLKSQHFSIQGYCLTFPGTINTQALDAYTATTTGTWEVGSGYNTDNRTWWFMTEEQPAQFENALNSLKFNPVEGQVIYLKNQNSGRGRDDSFLVDNGDDLLAIKPLTVSKARQNENNAKWEVIKADTGYMIKNVVTGKYLRYIGVYGSTVDTEYRGANFIIPADFDELEAVRYKFDINIHYARGVYSIGVYGQTAYFEKQGYAIKAIDSPNGQVLDAYAPTYTGTYNAWDSDLQVWWLMTEADLDAFSDAVSGSKFAWEEGAKYTIRPYNFWVTAPTDLGLTDEEFEAEYRNCRLVDNFGELWMLKADENDEYQQWDFTPTDDNATSFFISNAGTGAYLTIMKWDPISGVSDFDIAAPATMVTDFGEIVNQSIQIDFWEYGKDEAGKPVKVFGIGNNNPVDYLATESRGKEKFYLDYWNDGKSWAGMQVANYPNWAGGPAAAQRFLIRKAGEGGSSIKDQKTEAIAKVRVVSNGIVVDTPENVSIAVYSFNGALVKKTTNENISLVPGFYIVKVGNEIFKVFVK